MTGRGLLITKYEGKQKLLIIGWGNRELIMNGWGLIMAGWCKVSNDGLPSLSVNHWDLPFYSRIACPTTNWRNH